MELVEMSQKLKVLICGTGFAGQGHTDAFRDVSADVVGIVGRTESVVREVAEKLNIPYAGTDWEQALRECQPDVVSIGTPGGAHVEPITEGDRTWMPCVLRQAACRKR